MKQLIIYIHGLGGSADEAEHYKSLFPGSDVAGFDYKSQTPWEAKEEFPEYVRKASEGYDDTILIANSLGAYFSLMSLGGIPISKAFLISPVVDMERMIAGMMKNENITEKELKEKSEIRCTSGAVLSWEYLCYVRNNPIEWKIPTYILYGSNDMLVEADTVRSFADRTGAPLTIMGNGEHWFHTEEQMRFLDKWIEEMIRNEE